MCTLAQNPIFMAKVILISASRDQNCLYYLSKMVVNCIYMWLKEQKEKDFNKYFSKKTGFLDGFIPETPGTMAICFQWQIDSEIRMYGNYNFIYHNQKFGP
jgi:hypothetical protein